MAGAGGQQRAGFFEEGGAQPVVPVQNQYQAGPGGADAGVPGGRDAAVGPPDHLDRHRRGARFDPGQYGKGGRVGRAVVHQKDAGRPHRLAVQGIQGFQDERTLIVAGDHRLHGG